MRISHLVLATSLISFGGAAGALAAGHGWGGGARGDVLTRGITLTDAQKEQIHAIEKSAWSTSKATMKQLRGIHEQISAKLLSAGSVTEADITPLLQEEESLKATLDQARLSTELQVRNLLTPDQLAQAATLHQQLTTLHEQEHALMRSSATSSATPQ
jgi:Spy/CpxP family protein refolding chaperone